MHKKNKSNRKLREARERKGWSQQRLATVLGTTQTNVSRWEKGVSTPSYYYRELLCVHLGMKLEDFPELPDAANENYQSLPEKENESDSQKDQSAQSNEESERQREDFKDAREEAFHTPLIAGTPSLPAYWWMPYERNPYFINREVLLKKLATDHLDKSVSLPVYAMSGTPGVGKTQVAVEYVYRHMEHYQAVFWIRSDEQETFFADITDIIQLLDLPEKESGNQRLMLHAFQQWLARHTNWLLIFDNVERLELITSFISIQRSGHILLTTRTAAIGKPAVKMDVTSLEAEEGVTFLLRRANMIQQDEASEVVAAHEQEQAKSLVVEMGGLPLALDQAGAYIEELSCSLSEYVDLYHTYRKMLLERRGERTSGHPASLVTTISLSLEKIRTLNPDAIELLYIYVFLHPEKIPKAHFLREDVPDLSFRLQRLVKNPALLNEALGVLVKYALVRIEAEAPEGISKSSSEGSFVYMHRLVQDVLKDLLEINERRQLAEQAVRVMNRTLASLEYAEWHRYHHYIAHAQACVTLIDAEHIISEDAAQLLSWVARYLHEQSLYDKVEPLIQKSLAILSLIKDPKQLDTLDNLNQLASLLLDQGNYEEAGQLYLRILATIEPEQGPISQL